MVSCCFVVFQANSLYRRYAVIVLEVVDHLTEVVVEDKSRSAEVKLRLSSGAGPTQAFDCRCRQSALGATG